MLEKSAMYKQFIAPHYGSTSGVYTIYDTPINVRNGTLGFSAKLYDSDTCRYMSTSFVGMSQTGCAGGTCPAQYSTTLMALSKEKSLSAGLYFPWCSAGSS